MLLSGASMLASPTSTITAQLLTGGLHGGSFDQGHDHNDPGGVYYTASQGQQEAVPLYYVNAGFPHDFNSDDRSRMTTLLYPQQDTGGPASEQQTSYAQQHYGDPFEPVTLAHSALHQRALEAMGPHAGIPLSHFQDLSAGHHVENERYSNWRNGGNEHSFLPINDSSQSAQPQFGTNLPQYEVTGVSHDLSHAHQPDHFHHDVEHGAHLNQSFGSSINVQGLSLSLSSHQPQSAALRFASAGEDLPEANGIDAIAALTQAAAIANRSKDVASRYFPAANNAGLSRFRTPSREGVPGTRFHLHQVDVGGRKHLQPNLSGPAMSGRSGSIPFSVSKFLRSAQDILNEVCRVTSLKRSSRPTRSSTQEMHWNVAAGSSASIDENLTYHGKDERGSMHTDVDSVRDPSSFADTSPLITVSRVSNTSEYNQTCFADTARTENRDDLEVKKERLCTMLDGVETRYRRYCDHLQLIVDGFNSQAGPDAATPYTILAHQAMSRHFRCLRDAIGCQLRVVKRSLGEDVARGETSRLRYVDQQIRGQQRALQQLGILQQQQHAWRPQRGLPERAVTVLRAWLFEHFLHPYPKDVDKLALAKQTGLTRSQVSNWFINARVRLWKPMVEEMYQEEQKEAEEGIATERMPRDQIDTRITNDFRQNGGGREHMSGMLSEITRVIQTPAMPHDSKDNEENNRDAHGPSVKEGQEICPETSTVIPSEPLSVEPHLHVDGEVALGGTYNEEGREPKKARKFGSDTFNSCASMMPPGLGGSDVDTCAKPQGYSPAGDERCIGYSSRETTSVNQTTSSNGVSLTLGLRHSETNLKSSMGPESVLDPKYNMDMDDQSGVHQLNGVNHINGRIDDIDHNCVQVSDGFNNGHYSPVAQEYVNTNSNQHLSPGYKRLASQLSH